MCRLWKVIWRGSAYTEDPAQTSQACFCIKFRWQNINKMSHLYSAEEVKLRRKRCFTEQGLQEVIPFGCPASSNWWTINAFNFCNVILLSTDLLENTFCEWLSDYTSGFNDIFSFISDLLASLSCPTAKPMLFQRSQTLQLFFFAPSLRCAVHRYVGSCCLSAVVVPMSK